jgi:hypothetical protein
MPQKWLEKHRNHAWDAIAGDDPVRLFSRRGKLKSSSQVLEAANELYANDIGNVAPKNRSLLFILAAGQVPARGAMHCLHYLLSYFPEVYSVEEKKHIAGLARLMGRWECADMLEAPVRPASTIESHEPEIQAYIIAEGKKAESRAKARQEAESVYIACLGEEAGEFHEGLEETPQQAKERAEEQALRHAEKRRQKQLNQFRGPSLPYHMTMNPNTMKPDRNYIKDPNATAQPDGTHCPNPNYISRTKALKNAKLSRAKETTCRAWTMCECSYANCRYKHRPDQGHTCRSWSRNNEGNDNDNGSGGSQGSGGSGEKCDDGDRCRYQHGDSGPPKGAQQVPLWTCRAWMEGRCVSGDNCRYLHGGEKEIDSKMAQNSNKAAAGSPDSTPYNDNGSNSSNVNSNNGNNYNNRNHGDYGGGNSNYNRGGGGGGDYNQSQNRNNGMYAQQNNLDHGQGQGSYHYPTLNHNNSYMNNHGNNGGSNRNQQHQQMNQNNFNNRGGNNNGGGNGYNGNNNGQYNNNNSNHNNYNNGNGDNNFGNGYNQSNHNNSQYNGRFKSADTEICSGFANGSCQFGDSCRYLHQNGNGSQQYHNGNGNGGFQSQMRESQALAEALAQARALTVENALLQAQALALAQGQGQTEVDTNTA